MRYFVFLLILSFSAAAKQHDFSWSGVIPASVTSLLTKTLNIETTQIRNKAELEQFIQKKNEFKIIRYKHKASDIHMILTRQEL